MALPCIARTRKTALISLAVLCIAPTVVSAQTLSSRAAFSAPKSGVNRKLVAAYGKLPLAFERNQGQTDPQVRFLSRGMGYSLFLTPTEAVFGLQKPASTPRARQFARRTAAQTVRTALRMRLVGANPLPGITGQQILPSKLNYFVGSDPAKWHSNVAAYGQVLYKHVYPGIDLLYYGNQRQLEYDFTLAAHADPGKIKLGFDGATRLYVDTAGNLMVGLHGGDVRWHKPVCYQQVNGKRQAVAGAYVLLGENRVSFALAKYDRTKPLVIDPSMGYSTYIGGSADDTVTGIAVDGSGSATICGYTDSTDYPHPGTPFQKAIKGQYDVFVSKFSPDGSSLVYSTYVGGSDYDYSGGIAVDSAGNAYVTGDTSSTDFPIFPKPGAAQTAYGGDPADAFVFKLSADGSHLLYSTYLGGNDFDTGYAIAVDANGSAYVTGATISSNFTTTSNAAQTIFGGVQDVFVVKLSPDGTSLVYSTYIGGSADEEGNAIAVDTHGNAYVAGYTASPDFPNTTGFFQPNYGGDPEDGFVVKLSADGSQMLYATYLGGSGDDTALSIAVDANGYAYVAGATGSTDFPMQNPYQNANAGGLDAFVSELAPDGKSLLYSTYLGGGLDDVALGIAVDASGSAYVAGYTLSTDFPTSSDALQAQLDSGEDAFVAKLSVGGTNLAYGTFLGGSDSDSAVGIALHGGIAYLGGYTFSPDYPVTPSAYQMSNNGGFDSFVTRLNFFTRYDFNGDGSADILLQDPSNGNLAAWTMNGLTRQSAVHIYNGFGPYRVVAVDDFNGDNQNDIILQNPSTGTVICWFMNGFQRLGNPVYVTTNLSADFTVVGAADFDGDGKPDLILQDQKNAQIVVWLLDGVKLKSRRTLLAAGAIDPNWHIVGNSDFNGNGVQALFFQNQATNRLSVWLFKNLVFLGSAYLDKIPPVGWHVMGVADLKGDGTPTLLLQDHSSGRLAAWFLSGTHVSGAVYLSGAVPPGYQATGLR